MPLTNLCSKTPLTGCLIIFLVISCLSSVHAQFGSSKQVYNFGGLGLPELIQVADVDGDGDIDIIIKADGSSEPVFWLANDGIGNFNGLPRQLSIGQNNLAGMVSLQTIDFDKDGDQDIIGAFQNAKKILLWPNLASDNFSDPITVASSLSEMHSLLIYDMDHDGDEDVAVAMQYDDALWLENDLEQNTWRQKPLSIGDADYLDAADVNGDGVLDVFSLLDNTSNGIFKNGQTIASRKMAPATYLKLVDIDADGDLDVIAAIEEANGGISWLENISGTYHHKTIEGSAGSRYQSITIFDYDDDGDQDILAGCFTFCGIDLFDNNGGGKFTQTKSIGSGGIEEQSLLSADLNGDGRKDIIRSNSATHTVAWQPNTTTPFTGIEASFRYEGKCLRNAIVFTNTVRGKNVTGYRWNFGDGSPISVAKNPTHLFAQTGTYTVSLMATNASGQSSSYQTTVTIEATPALDDLRYQFCTVSYTATLDPSFQYNWYGNLNDATPFRTANTLNAYTYTSQTFYVTRTGPSGCASDRSKVVFENFTYPSKPAVTGSSVFTGKGTMELQAVGQPGDKIYWSTSPNGNPFFSGNRYASQFTETTTYYVKAVNNAGCSSASVPVMASVYNRSTPAPVFAWADATQSTFVTRSIDMQRDANGNILVFGAWGNGDVRAGGFSVEGTSTFANRFLIRYDQAGSVLQLKKVISNATLQDQFENMMVDKDNNTYLYFGFRDDFAFDDQTITPPTSDKTYTFIGKLDEQGNYLWHKIIDSQHALFALKSNGNIICVANQLYNIMQISELSKNSGDIVWETQHSALDMEDLVVDESDNIYLSGSTYNFFESIVVNTPGEYSTVAIAKYKPDGTYEWSKRFSQNTNISTNSHLAVDNEGNLVISAEYNNGFRPSEITTILGVPVGEGPSTAVAKLKPDGTTLWVKCIHFNSGGIINDLAIDADNDIFMVGNGIGGHFDWFTDNNNTAFVAQYTGTGEFQWHRGINFGSVFPKLKKVMVTNDGNVVIFGDFRDYLSLDQISLSSATHGDFVNENIFTAKLGYTFNADFKYDISCVGKSIQFADGSKPRDGRTIVSWNWSFGDGGHSTEQNPTHTFSVVGDYTVSLEVTDNTGDKKTKISLLKVQGITNAAHVDILPSKSFVCEGDEVKYTASVSNVGANYTVQWYVNSLIQPDATDRLEYNSIAEIQKEITVTVNGYSNLCATNPIAAASVILPVNAIPQTPVINASARQVCTGNTATLTVDGTYQSYKWSNGSQTPQLDVDLSGTYSLQVGLSNQCLSKVSKPVAITILPGIVAAITVDGDSLRASDGSYYIWSKNNVELISHRRAIKRDPGIYTVKVFNDYDCSAISNPVTIFEPLKSDFASNKQIINVGESVNFTTLSTGSPTTFEWEFEGGTPSQSNDVNPIGITYKSPGTYAVSLKVSGNIQTNIKTIVGYITVQAMHAEFTSNKTEAIVNEVLNFIDHSSGSPSTYEWQFTGATPSTSTLPNPSIRYLNPGTYSISLTIRRGEYQNTIVKNEFIKVYPLLVSNFDISGPDDIVSGQAIDFISTVQGQPDSYEWIFSGGIPSSSHEINPVGIVFPNAGSFEVSLVVKDKLQISEKKTFITVKTITEIEVRVDDVFNIYPNPTDGNIKIRNVSTPFDLRIYNSVGNLVGVLSNLDSDFLHLDLQAGLYLIKVTHKDDVYYRKIIIR